MEKEMAHLMRTMAAVVLLLLPAAALVAADPSPPPATTNRAAPASSRTEFDRNGDGRTDYVVVYDKQGLKATEEFDFNYDGVMDDFLFYTDGVLVREEVDSNYDGKIDLWVYLDAGVYIKKYERDLNGDGIPDVTKVY